LKTKSSGAKIINGGISYLLEEYIRTPAGIKICEQDVLTQGGGFVEDVGMKDPGKSFIYRT